MSRKDGTKRGAGTIFGLLGVLGLALLKFKVYIFAAFKGLSFLKFAWLFKSFISMFVTIGAYSMLFGWQFGVIIVLLILIHEMGHYIWMKALGLDPKLPMFIPFVGAYVAMTKLPPDQATHAWVSIAGPLVGGLGAAAIYWAGVHTSNLWLMAAGSTGFMLNLVQLVPAKPLDGGFIIQALSKWLLVPGTALLFTLALMWHSILLLVIAVISLFALFHQLTFKRSPEDQAAMAEVPLTVRDLERQGAMGARSFGPAAELAGEKAENEQQRPELQAADAASDQANSVSQSSNAAGGAGAASQQEQTAIPPSQYSFELTPASPFQKCLIGVAYISLAGMLGYLYWLSHSETVRMLPAKHREQIMQHHEPSAANHATDPAVEVDDGTVPAPRD
ncbi:MAG TPA: site-2 protease family protein [Candidatus Obscuribacterales bacterium]